MTALTPEDAKAKICPLSMAREKLVRCQGPACMVWRWSAQERQDARDAYFVERMKAMGVDVTTAGTTDLTLTLSDGSTTFVNALEGDAVGSAGSGGSNAQYYAAETGVTLAFGVAAPGVLVAKVWALVANTVGDEGDVPGTV